MTQQKMAYYVDMTSERVLPEPLESPSFTIYATRQEVAVLERIFEKNHEKDMESYVRAHIPTFEYFDDPVNKKYDATMKMVYAVIYALGDEEAKRHIEGMGILSGNKAENPTYVREEDR